MQKQYEFVESAEAELVTQFFQCPLCEFYKIREEDEFFECPRCGISWNSLDVQSR